MAAELTGVTPKRQERVWIHNGLLPLGELVFLDGATGVGKSALCADLLAVFSGKRDTPDRPKLLYVSSPDQVILRNHHLAVHEAAEDVIYSAWFEPPFTLDPEKDKQPSYVVPFLMFLEEHVKTHHPFVVVIDSLDELFTRSGPTRVSSWRMFWRDLRKLAVQQNCTIIVTRQHGLNEARHYGDCNRIGTEMAHFILTMHWHPIHADQRIITVARDLTGPMGEQFHATFINTGRLQLRLVPIYEHVRPARRPQTWQVDPDHVNEHRQIADDIEKLMCNKPTRSSELKEAMKGLGHSARAVQRTLGMMKVPCRNVKGIWFYLPTKEMSVREACERIQAESEKTPISKPRAAGAEVGGSVKLAG